MKSILQFASMMVLCAGSAFAQQYTEARYEQLVALPNCGGLVQTKCTSGDKCYINIMGSKCNTVRLYDTVTVDNKGNKFFAESVNSTHATLAPISGNAYRPYSTSEGQLWASKSRFQTSFWNAFLYGREYKHYVTMFISDNNSRPYDRVVLWFKKR